MMKRKRINDGASRSRLDAVHACARLALALAALLASPAWAGRPLATEDAGVLGKGGCELESYAGRLRGSGSARVSSSWAQFGCGVGGATQLALGAGNEDSDGERARPAALSGKTTLRELTDARTGVVVAYTLSGTLERGSRYRPEATELKLVLSAPRAGWLLHANLGAQYARAEKHYGTVWGLAVERPGAIGPVDLMAEIYGDDSSAPWLQFGARWTVVPDRLYLDASGGLQTGGDHAKQATVGVKVAF